MAALRLHRALSVPSLHATPSPSNPPHRPSFVPHHSACSHPASSSTSSPMSSHAPMSIAHIQTSEHQSPSYAAVFSPDNDEFDLDDGLGVTGGGLPVAGPSHHHHQREDSNEEGSFDGSSVRSFGSGSSSSSDGSNPSSPVGRPTPLSISAPEHDPTVLRDFLAVTLPLRQGILSPSRLLPSHRIKQTGVGGRGRRFSGTESEGAKVSRAVKRQWEEEKVAMGVLRQPRAVRGWEIVVD